MKNYREKEIHDRMMTGKRRRYTNEERKNYMNEEARKRDKYEANNMGNYTKIFVLNEEQMLDYHKYYEYAFELHNQSKANSLVSITPSSSVTQYPYYRHYFDDLQPKKLDTTSTSFSKAKKPPNTHTHINK